MRIRSKYVLPIKFAEFVEVYAQANTIVDRNSVSMDDHFPFL